MTAPSSPRPPGPIWTRGPWLALLLLVVTLLARAQTFGNPIIEFDEQFYRLVGERMVHGAVPYLDIWDRKPIGLFLLYEAAALVGGAHPLAYQTMAALAAAGTAWLVHAMAAPLVTGWRGPLFAALLVILWLNLLQGEGGQAGVLFGLPMCGAALIVLRQMTGERGARHLPVDGALAMLLVGLAMQIKYTVAIEGGYFALALLWAGRRAGLGTARLAALALLWAGLALLPTLLAWGSYVAMGQSDVWIFANFTSILLREPMPFTDMVGELGGGLATMVLLVSAALIGWRRMGRGAGPRFVAIWALVAFAALLAMRSFVPHYWIPLVPPLALLAAPAAERLPRLAIGLVALAALVGQILIGFFIQSKGDARTVDHMVAAIGPVPHCLFVFDGFPSLYGATKSCLPSRFLFASHLNGSMEAGAIGVEPVAEVERIMASRPDAVVLDEPRWNLRNLATNAVVDRELAAHYRLALREPTGTSRWRLVYRVKPEDARP